MVVEQIGMQAYRLKLSQQAGSIRDVFHILLLKLYIFNRSTPREPSPPIEMDSEEKYKLGEVLQSEYRYGTFCNCVK